MFSSKRGRFSAAALAAVVVGAGLLAAAPANADNAAATITVANTVYTEGNWGAGLDVTGTGFAPGSLVTVTLDVAGVAVDNTTITALPDGSYSVAGWVPAADSEVATNALTLVRASDDTGNTADPVTLSIRRTPGVISNVTTISTSDLADPNGGIELLASGFEPGESVTVTGVYNGVSEYQSELVADDAGSVYLHVYLESGTAEAGNIVFTLAGAAHTETTTIAITGETISVGDGNANFGGGAVTPATAPKLPVVSG